MTENNIKKTREIAASLEKVFQAITEENLLKKWWVDIPKLEKSLGGKINFRFLKEHSETLTEDYVVEGEITDFKQNDRLAYTWRPINDSDYPTTIVSWNLEKISDEKTRLTLTHSGLKHVTDVSKLEQGWEFFLNRLVDFFK